MKTIAYWNGNIPPVTRLFFSSFLATQKGILELYLENCNDLGPAKDYLNSKRIIIKEVNLNKLCKGTVFERFSPNRSQNFLDGLIIKLYSKYFVVKRNLYEKFLPDKLPQHRSCLVHPLMGLTPTSKPIVNIPFYGAVRDQYNLAFWGDIFRLLMSILEKEDFVYVDLDVCFLKDFTPLFKGEDFVYEWEHQAFANSAVMFSSRDGILKKRISEIVEKYDTVTPWFVFSKEEPLLEELRILSCELFDPLWKQESPNFDRFFEDNSVMELLDESYAYHWHNHWRVLPKEGSCYSHLLNKFEAYLGTLP